MIGSVNESGIRSIEAFLNRFYVDPKTREKRVFGATALRAWARQAEYEALYSRRSFPRFELSGYSSFDHCPHVWEADESEIDLLPADTEEDN